MKTYYLPALLALALSSQSQEFTRSELSATLTHPWEMSYGPDGYLWVSEDQGTVSRVDPNTGNKTIAYKAPDFFGGHTSECCQLCHQPQIGSGCLGLALHPDFTNPSTSYIYYVYSYNSGTDDLPCTKFKISRLTWNAGTNSVTDEKTIVDQLPTGYDHFGGRLMIVEQKGTPYLFFAIGDNGVSEDNSPDCYKPASANPNYFAQDPNHKTGKIHRFNLDGSVPSDNPIAGNSFYTRGHRNPQGLIYNYDQKIIYNVEHGDRTDDEINVLEAGMNYGWKQVRGYHGDDNYSGEAQYVANYTPHAAIANDGLREPMYAWCAATQYSDVNNINWGTVAPSDGIYYGSEGIPGWKNSILVGTLKKGNLSKREVYRFKLNPDGKTLAPSTVSYPNPEKFFSNDQALNGRIRDIALSPDGKKIYLLSDGGLTSDRISVYSYVEGSSDVGIRDNKLALDLKVYPNPATDFVNIECSDKVCGLELCNVLGDKVNVITTNTGISLMNLPQGTYLLKMKTTSGTVVTQRLQKN